MDTFILLCIFGNIIIMAMNYENSTTEYDNGLKIANLVFTYIFIAESIFKITAYGFIGYFFNGWN